MISLTQFAVVLAFYSMAVTALNPRLVPSKRAVSLERRSLYKRDIALKDSVTLRYGLSPYHPPTAAVTLSARPDLPILLLEEVDHLLTSLTCHETHRLYGRSIVVEFGSDEHYREALEQWGTEDSFAVITLSLGCIPHDERGVYIVSAIILDPSTLHIVLLTEPTTMRDIVRSFSVKYDHTDAQTWSQTREDNGGSLTRREDHGTDQIFEFGYKPDVPARLPLFPPDTSVDEDITSDIISTLTNSEFAVTCVDCHFQTNISVGMSFDVFISDDLTSCATDEDVACFELKNVAMNLTVENFEQDMGLEVFIGKELQIGANYKIFKIPVGPSLSVASLVDLGLSAGLEIAFELDITSNINFTFGGKAHIPSGAFASVSLVDGDGNWNPHSHASGWDDMGVDQIPLRVNGGEFNVSTSLALAPFVELGMSIVDVGAALRLIENVPKASTSASIRTQVNRQCQPLNPSTDFESFDSAFIVGAGLSLGLEAQLILKKGKFLGKNIPSKFDLSIFNMDLPFFPAPGIDSSACFVLSDTDGSDQPAPTGTLLAAESAIPTWNIAGIESYYSANGGQLPTGVNYGQMLKATTVPDDIKDAVKKAGALRGMGDVGSCGWKMVVVGAMIFGGLMGWF